LIVELADSNDSKINGLYLSQQAGRRIEQHILSAC
jgi:hypothetical protein